MEFPSRISGRFPDKWCSGEVGGGMDFLENQASAILIVLFGWYLLAGFLILRSNVSAKVAKLGLRKVYRPQQRVLDDPDKRDNAINDYRRKLTTYVALIESIPRSLIKNLFLIIVVSITVQTVGLYSIEIISSGSFISSIDVTLFHVLGYLVLSTANDVLLGAFELYNWSFYTDLQMTFDSADYPIAVFTIWIFRLVVVGSALEKAIDLGAWLISSSNDELPTLEEAREDIEKSNDQLFDKYNSPSISGYVPPVDWIRNRNELI